jgi:hypothetical protein
VIDFFVGLLVGIDLTALASLYLDRHRRHELEAENRAYREVIRHAARSVPNLPLRRYLERALGDDEAGA